MTTSCSSFDEAVRLFIAGRIEAANELCRLVLQTHPYHFDATRLLGVTFGQLGRHEEALPVLKAVALAHPTDPEGHMNLGATLSALGQNQKALEACEIALALKPDYGEALYLRGKALTSLGRLEEALAPLRQAVALRPDFGLALSALGRALFDLRRFDEACACFDQRLRLTPHCAETLVDRGDASYELKRYGEALEFFDRAIAIRPDFALALVQRGNTLDLLSRFEDALQDYDHALAVAPNLPLALSNRANTLKELGRFAEARADFDAVLALAPDDAVARFNRAHLLLLLGHLAEGLDDYECRKRVQNRSFRSFATPEWSHPTPGETVLVHTEQGLGDTLQFARFAQRLALAGGDIVLEVQPELWRLLQSLDGVRVVRRGDALPSFTAHIQIMSLPRALGVTLDDLAQGPYLRAEPDRVEAWAQRLPPGRFRIGIAWQGSAHERTDRGRSFPLAIVAPLVDCSDVVVVSLQKNAGLEQLASCSFADRIHTLGADFDSGADAFLDTAAVLETLDLVVTSDTALAHLAGALGRPVWVALQYVPNWRWLLGRTDSPWYPTARLFRQPRPGDWASVFEEIAESLADLVASGRGPS